MLLIFSINMIKFKRVWLVCIYNVLFLGMEGVGWKKKEASGRVKCRLQGVFGLHPHLEAVARHANPTEIKRQV